jgi:hypothetical protein
MRRELWITEEGLDALYYIAKINVKVYISDLDCAAHEGWTDSRYFIVNDLVQFLIGLERQAQAIYELWSGCEISRNR